MLDMSKAFDTVNRTKLFEILKTCLGKDEIHILKILTENVILKVKVQNETGEDITTDTGVPPGTLLSALLFILYLAEALKPPRNNIENEHNYGKSTDTEITIKTVTEEDHCYSQKPKA